MGPIKNHEPSPYPENCKYRGTRVQEGLTKPNTKRLKETPKNGKSDRKDIKEWYEERYKERSLFDIHRVCNTFFFLFPYLLLRAIEDILSKNDSFGFSPQPRHEKMETEERIKK